MQGLMSVSEVIEREIASGMPLGPFHRRWLIENKAPEVVRKNLALGKKYPNLYMMARQGFTSLDTNDVNTAAFAAINTTISESNIVGSTQALINQFCSIAANDAKAGKIYKVTFGGTYGNTGTPTIIWTPRWGISTTPGTNVSLGASPTITTITGVSALPFYGEFRFDVRTAPPGATQGTGRGQGYVVMGIPVTNSQYAQISYMGNTAATIDTTGQGTAGCGITINITWGTSSASNTLTCESYILSSLN
jgi:hypothetical protein